MSSTQQCLPLTQQGTFDGACKLVSAVLPRGHCCPTTAEILHFMAVPQPEVVGACVNDCCVFCKALKEMGKCPTCDTERLVEGKERKEFRYIPLARQLQHMFADPELAAKLRRDRPDWPKPQPGHIEVSLFSPVSDTPIMLVTGRHRLARLEQVRGRGPHRLRGGSSECSCGAII